MVDRSKVVKGATITCEFVVEIANKSGDLVGPFVRIPKGTGGTDLVCIPYNFIKGVKAPGPFFDVPRDGTVITLRRGGFPVKVKWQGRNRIHDYKDGWLLEPFIDGTHLYQDSFFDQTPWEKVEE